MRQPGSFLVVAKTDHPEDLADQLVTMFEGGALTQKWTFEEVRERAAI